MSRVDVTVTPFFKACVFAFCIVGPSAIGSVNGRPSSMRSTEDQWLTPQDGAQISNTSTTSFHAQKDIDGFFGGWIAGGNICHQSGSFLLFALRECLLDTLHIFITFEEV